VTLFDEPTTLTPPAPRGPVVRVRMTVAYLGTKYRGFAAQPGVPTVGGALIDALSTVLRHPVDLTCAGRTDAGVHAWGQVVSFDAAEGADPVELQRRVNKLVGPDVVVRDVALGPDGFDARRWATGRAYRYTVVNRPVADPFLTPLAWHVEEPLDLRAMQLACDPLIGEHDFTSFCRRPPGRGKVKAGDLAWIIRSRDRSNGAGLAPPRGLCLWAVSYDGRIT
jgi:tRNA pseudouridine38-40 synthase